MKQVNSYFQLNIEGDKVYLVIYPPAEGGQRLDFQEISDYLNKKNYNNLDVIAIGRGIMADEVSRVLIAQGKKYPEAEDVKIVVSDNKREAIASLLLLVHRKGLEPPTLGTGIRCSIH